MQAKTEVEEFYEGLSSDLELFLTNRGVLPTHIVMFGDLYQAQSPDSQTTRTYRLVTSSWNGFDILQDDARRRGGIIVLENLRPS